MFVTVTRSLYVMFGKVEGFSKNPTISPSLSERVEESNEDNDESLNFNENYTDPISPKIITIFVATVITLEDQIVEGLQLSKLGLLKLRSIECRNILGDLNPLIYTSKSSAIASNIMTYNDLLESYF